MDLILSSKQFYEGLNVILKRAEPIDLSDPAWAAGAGVESSQVSGCLCGTNSFRILSITPEGRIPVSPCVYLHDFKYGDLSKQRIEEILDSVYFENFRKRKANPELVEGCKGCKYIATCGGGCASRAYLHNLHNSLGKMKNLFLKDPYCPKDNQILKIKTQVKNCDDSLVHIGYLCTGIFKVKN